MSQNQKYKPKQINILGKIYKVKYCKNPVDVDSEKRESLWGQIDFWERIIRIYDNGRQKADIFESIMHEVFHGIVSELKIKSLDPKDKEKHDDLDRLAVALTDTLFRNGILK